MAKNKQNKSDKILKDKPKFRNENRRYKTINQVLKTDKGKEFLSGQKIVKKVYESLQGENLSLPKGGKKAFLVTGPRKFDFTTAHEKTIVNSFKRFKSEYGDAIITHDYNADSATSNFIDKVAKKHNLPVGKRRSVEDYGENGASKRTLSRQKAQKEGILFHAQFNQKGVLKTVDADQHLQDMWRRNYIRIGKERIEGNRITTYLPRTKYKGQGKLLHRRTSGIGKNTQAEKALVSQIAEIKDYAPNSDEFKAGVRWVEKENQRILKNFGKESGVASSFLKEVSGEKPPEGISYRKDIGLDTEYVEDFNIDSKGAGTDKPPKGLVNRGTILKHLGSGKFVKDRGKGYSKTASTEEFSKAEFTKPDELKRYQKSIITEGDYEKSTLQTHTGSHLEKDQARYRKELKDLNKLPFIENRVRSVSESISSSGKNRYKKALASNKIKVPDMLTEKQDELYKDKKLETKVRGTKLPKFMGGFVLSGLLSALFAKKDLKAKGIETPTPKQFLHQTASSFVGFPRILGGVGEEKGWVQNVGLTKKGVSGKRRPNLAIKGAGGPNTPAASIMKFFSPSTKDAWKNRKRVRRY